MDEYTETFEQRRARFEEYWAERMNLGKLYNRDEEGIFRFQLKLAANRLSLGEFPDILPPSKLDEIKTTDEDFVHRLWANLRKRNRDLRIGRTMLWMFIGMVGGLIPRIEKESNLGIAITLALVFGVFYLHKRFRQAGEIASKRKIME